MLTMMNTSFLQVSILILALHFYPSVESNANQTFFNKNATKAFHGNITGFPPGKGYKKNVRPHANGKFS